MTKPLTLRTGVYLSESGIVAHVIATGAGSLFLFRFRPWLEQADKDIVKANLSLQYRWKPIKSGRGGKVTAIRFSFGGDNALREGDDEELIRARLAKLSSSCYFGLMKRKVECTPKPAKSAKCKYCVEHGNMSLKLKAKKGRAAPIGGVVV